jgi:hypothetical protein
MTANLHSIARSAEELVGLEAGDLVVDIGCNDGTLFDGFGTDGLRYLGFDPSDVARYAIEKGYDVVRDFFGAEAQTQRYPDRKARVITSIAMFYDLEDPLAFLRDVSSGLAEDGIWVMELHYLLAMLEKNSFDAIVHEHLEYYSPAVIERLLAEAGLEVIRAELNEMNGGSIRLFIAHAGRRTPRSQEVAQLQAIRLREFEVGLDSAAPYDRFAENCHRVRDELHALCQRLTADSKQIHVDGASTKGNTILQFAGLDSSMLPYAADRNPDKWESVTIRTNIPIISEEESRRMRPDYYLVLPWHFLEEFVEREREYLSEGGRFIVPLPEVRVIGPDGEEPT